MSTQKHEFFSIAPFVETIHVTNCFYCSELCRCHSFFQKIHTCNHFDGTKMETVIFGMVIVNNLCQNQLVSVIVEKIDGIDTLVVSFNSEEKRV